MTKSPGVYVCGCQHVDDDQDVAHAGGRCSQGKGLMMMMMMMTQGIDPEKGPYSLELFDPRNPLNVRRREDNDNKQRQRR